MKLFFPRSLGCPAAPVFLCMTSAMSTYGNVEGAARVTRQFAAVCVRQKLPYHDAPPAPIPIKRG